MSIEDLQRTVTIVDAYITLALGRTCVDLMPLSSRLESLVNPERSWSSPGRDREIQLERSVWVREIREGLLPASQLALAASLRTSRGTRQASDDPWAELDPEFVVARDATYAEVWTRAQLDVMRAAGKCPPWYMDSALQRFSADRVLTAVVLSGRGRFLRKVYSPRVAATSRGESGSTDKCRQ